MFKTIVVGMDGSDRAAHALTFAVELARRDQAAVVIAHVEEDIVAKGGGPIVANVDEVKAEIEAKAKELSSAGIDTRVEAAAVYLGGPAPAIAEIAEQAGADLIVVGTRGHTAIAGVLLGSVAQRLLHLASQPVLVIPDDAQLARAE